MKILFIVFFCLASFPIILLANDRYLSDRDLKKCLKQKFDEFHVAASTPSVKTVKYSIHPDAKEYSRSIELSYKNGTNFAGHYTIAVWACGTSCQSIAIVDGNSGEVVYSSGTALLYHDLDSKQSRTGVASILFDKNSNLFVVNPACPGENRDVCSNTFFGNICAQYYLWSNDKFVRIRSW